ncbi:MAG: hypothetical protein WCV93_04985 [Candidatus Shapirobacteria bacterium]|jgi:hypothetical protein
MKIQLFDRGTPQGKKLFSDLETVCKRLQIDWQPEFVHDMTRVYSMGVQCKTALMIDNEIAFVDKYPSLRDLETIVSDYIE